jgi:phage terminase small subunit
MKPRPFVRREVCPGKTKGKTVMNTNLTEREQAFLTAFFGLKGGRRLDASKAVRVAGYTGKRANQAAYKLTRRPRVIGEISRLEREQQARIETWFKQRAREIEVKVRRDRDATTKRLRKKFFRAG